jgi:hypothetical protein
MENCIIIEFTVYIVKSCISPRFDPIQFNSLTASYHYESSDLQGIQLQQLSSLVVHPLSL